MNEYCRIGLHSFGEWRDKDRSGIVQIRLCRHCDAVEQRDYQPETRILPPYDPYRDLG